MSDVPESSPELLDGSCLCGAVTYRVAAPFLRFVHCHCERCRKASGSAHASQLVVEPRRFAWVTGRELAVRYDLPAAAAFATTFCSRCGAPLPHQTRSGRHVIVPAGSLDAEPSLRPQAHAYVASRAGWSTCVEDGLPRFDEAPA
jgi:hypothetical protein